MSEGTSEEDLLAHCWDSVKGDIKSVGLSSEDAHWRLKSKFNK